MTITILSKIWKGTKYHCVHIQLMYWLDATHTWSEMQEWCKELFGPQGDPWQEHSGARWYYNDSKFWFREERDRTLFMLRWSHG